jgi:hypothetical protein
MATGEQLMIGMGFYPSDNGPNVTKLRNLMNEKAANGTRYVSPGTWAYDLDETGQPIPIPMEVRAEELLKFFTAIDSGMTYRVRLLDSGIFNRSYNLVTKKWEWDFRPENIIPRILDTRDYLIYRVKKLFNTKFK